MRALLLVHGVAALALLVASSLQTAASLPWLLGAAGRPRLAHLLSFIVPILLLTDLVLGLALYPTYRTEVRFAVLDVPRSAGGLGMAWLARLFDLKEHLVALALPASVGGGVLARVLGPEGIVRRRGLAVGLSCFVFVVVAVTAIVGLWVTSVREVS